MARLFNAANSEFLQSASTIDLSPFSKLSIAFWFWLDAFANDEKDLFIINEVNYILIRPNWSAGSFLVGTSGNVGASLQSFARPSAAAWHHFIMNIDLTLASNEVGPVYIDGSSQALTNQGNANNTNTFASSSNHLWMFDGGTLFAAGRVAEIAFWGGNLLSSTDATALSNGSKLPSDPSLSIGAATHYWKVCGAGSPEQPTIGSTNLTVTGTLQTPHPPNVTASCALAPIATPFLPGQMRGPRQYSFVARTQFPSAPAVAPVEEEDGVYVYHTATW